MPEKNAVAPLVDYFANRQRTKPTKLDDIDKMRPLHGKFSYPIEIKDVKGRNT